MKLVFRVGNDNNNIREVKVPAGYSKEMALEVFTKKYGVPCVECKKRTVYVFSKNGSFRWSEWIPEWEYMYGKRLMDSEGKEGPLYIVPKATRNNIAHLNELVYQYLVNFDDGMEGAMQMLCEETGLKSVLVTEKTELA